jgi:hypothetical protein
MQATSVAISHICELTMQLREAELRIGYLEEDIKKAKKRWEDRLEAQLQAYWDKTVCL